MQEIESKEPLKPGHVLPQEPVQVYPTEKDPFNKQGEPYTVHRALAEKLVASGKASMTKPKPAAPAAPAGGDQNK